MREPWQDADDYIYKAEQWLSMRPVCELCKEHIQEEGAFHARIDGVEYWICKRCYDEHYEFID